MSEPFLATAQVLVTPNTSKFRETLKTKLESATSKPVSVLVTPNTSKFASELRSKLKSVKLAPVHVLVKPDLRGFTQALRTESQARAEGVFVEVLARPVFTGFRTALRAGAVAAAEGVVVPVGAIPTAGAAGAAAAAGATPTGAPRKVSEEVLAERRIRAEQKVASQIRRAFIELEDERVAAAAAASAKIFADREAAEAKASAAARRSGQQETQRFLATEETKLAQARTASAAASTKLGAAESFVSRSKTASVAASQALTKFEIAERAAIAAHTKALLTDDEALQAHTAAQVEDAAAARLRAAALRQAAVVQEGSAALTAATAATQLSAARGAGAAAASFAGLRGAVLAANPAFIAGTVAVVAFGKAVQGAANLQSELSVFNTVAAATADEMKRVAEVARQLGSDVTLPGVGASDAAEALTTLAKAGLTVKDSIGAARGVLQLATAAQISNADATELTASALNAFGLAGTQAVHVADVLANSANAAQGSISDMGIALQQSSAVARQAGLNLEDTATFLTLLAKNGIRGSDAGTSLRVAITRLIAPTGEAAAVLKKLNVQVLDAQGNLRPEIFTDIAKAQEGLSRSTQNANAKTIFGVDALRAYSIAAREGFGSFSALRVTINDQGTAAQVAAARMVGLTGAIENLKNQLSTLGNTIGALVLPGLTDMANKFADNVKAANDLLESLKDIEGFIQGRLKIAFEDLPNFIERPARGLKDKFADAIGTLGNTKSLLLPGLAPVFAVKSFFDGDKAKEDVVAEGLKVRDGIEEMTRAAVLGAEDFGDQMSSSIQFALNKALSEIEAMRNKLVAGAIKNVGKGANQQLGLEDLMNQILLSGGGPSAQTGVLDKQAAAQQKIINDSLAGLTTLTSKDKGFATLTKALRAARAKLVSINSEKTSIIKGVQSDQEQAANDQKQKANELKQQRDAADQNVLDSLAIKAGPVDTQVLRASLGDSAKAVIAAARARKKQLFGEIKSIKDLFNNTKAAAAEVKSRRDQIVELDDQINDTQKELFKKQAEDAEKKAQAIFDSITKRAELAGLRGNKGNQLRLIDQAIANRKKEVARLKKLHKSTTDVEIEIENLIDQKDEIQKKAQDGGKEHTTAFDLLSEFNANFGKSGGNLIGGDQPFAGGSAFSGDIVNKAITSFTGPPHRPIDLRLRGEDVQRTQISVTKDLIGVIRENTESWRQRNGNLATASTDQIWSPTNPGWGAAGRKAREVRDG